MTLWFGGPALYRWYSERSAAQSSQALAAGLGLELSDTESIVYAEYHSSFPDSSAYLVVDSASATRAANLRRGSSLTACRAAEPSDFIAPLDGQRPAPSATLTYCEYRTDGGGMLHALWDPAVGDGRRTWIWAIQA